MTREGDSATSRAYVRATLFVMIGNLLSKLTGFVREVIIAPILGYGVNTDAYTMGFLIPDLFYQLLIGGAIAAVLTPTLAGGLARGMEKRVWRSVSTFMNVAIVVMIVTNVIGIAAAPFLINLYSRKHAPEVVSIAIRVTRTLFPQTLFLMLTGLCVGVLASYRRFSRSAFSATIYNVGCITFLFILGNKTALGPERAAIGVVLASMINFFFMFVLSRHEFRNYRPVLDTKDPAFRRLVRLALPTLLAGSVAQLNAIVLMHFADQFSGAMTSLRYADVAWNLPLGIFVISMASVMLPTLSAVTANRDHDGMRRIYTLNLRRSLFLVAPFAVLFFFKGTETIQAIFQWRHAIPHDRLLTTGSILKWYALALLFQTVIQITYVGFFARRVTRIALLTSLLSLILNPIFCKIYVQGFHMGVEGLSLAYATNTFFQMILMQAIYKRHRPEAKPYRLFPFVVRLALCAISAALVAMAFNTLGIAPGNKWLQLIYFALEVGAILGTYILTAKVIRLREVKDVLRLARRVVSRV